MKDTVTEIRNNLQGNNSLVDEAENKINDFKHKGAKNNHAEQEEKKSQKKKNEDGMEQLQTLQHSHHRGARRKRERT